MQHRNSKMLVAGLAATLAALASVAWAYQSDEAGANDNPPGYVSEGHYGGGTLGTLEQPKPDRFDTSSSYGITGDWPTYVPPLADGDGKDQVQAYCSICHNTTYISMQPPFPAKKWAATVHKMLDTFGAKQYIPDKAVPQIINYLQSHYTPKTIGKNTYGDTGAVTKTNAEGEKSSSTSWDKAQTAAAVPPAKENGPGAQVYNQNCTACHQANGQGIPGAFPPQAGHAPTLLMADGGRKYLAHVLLFGLQGSIGIDGNTYTGAMPSWAASLNDQQIADVLNYILTAWGNNQKLPTGFKSYTAKEIAAERSKNLTPAEVHDARDKLKLDAGAKAAVNSGSAVSTVSSNRADVPISTAVPAPVYATLQMSNEVEVIGEGTVWPGISSAHYDALSPDGKQLLVSNSDIGQVYLLDTASGQKKATFEIGEAAQGVKISPDGKRGLAIAPGAGEAAVLDLKNGVLIKKIKVGKTPHNARFTADGKTAYVTLQGEGAIAVIDMDMLKKSSQIAVDGMDQPHNLDLTDDGKRLWIRDFTGHVAVLEISSGKVLAHIDIGPSHGGIDVIPGGKYVATDAIGSRQATIIDQNSLKKVATIEVGQGPHGVRASADGRWLYVGLTTANKITVIDMETFKVVRDIPTQGKFPFWIAVKGNE